MVGAQSATSFKLEDGLYHLTTVKGSPLIMANRYSELEFIEKAKEKSVLERLYSVELATAEQKGRYPIPVLPLAQDHAELIRNAYLNLNEKGAKEALQSYRCNTLWGENLIIYLLDFKGFEGIIVVDRFNLKDRADGVNYKDVVLPEGYSIDGILNAEKELVWEGDGADVFKPKGYNARVIEGYWSKSHKVTEYTENNPMYLALFNGPERAEAFVRLARDKNYFESSSPGMDTASHGWNERFKRLHGGDGTDEAIFRIFGCVNVLTTDARERHYSGGIRAVFVEYGTPEHETTKLQFPKDYDREIVKSAINYLAQPQVATHLKKSDITKLDKIRTAHLKNKKK